MMRSSITKPVFSLLYNTLASAIWFSLRTFRHFNPRISKWVEGRENWRGALNPVAVDPIWCHMASLGEYEQILPVIRRLKQDGHEIVLSFFSPSGYEVVKPHEEWQHVYYLPIDLKREVRSWFDRIHPRLIIYVKYDIWYGYLEEGFRRGIPTVLVSAVFTKNKFYFKWYGAWMLRQLRRIDQVFVQDHTSVEIAQQNGLSVILSGDTRVDRSRDLLLSEYSNSQLEDFVEGHRVWIWASTHTKDEHLLMKWWLDEQPAGWKVIWAPHDLGDDHINQISLRYASHIDRQNGENQGRSILLLEQMGILKFVYRYADLVYMGGGFDSGIHNLLEPMSYGLPCIFGPKWGSFPEANYLIENKLGVSITGMEGLRRAFRTMDDESCIEMQQQIRQYLTTSGGASEKVFEWIKENVIEDE